MRPLRLGALALLLALLAVGVAPSACTTKETPAPVKVAKPGRVEVKKLGELVGVVHVTPGAPGRFERNGSSPDAKHAEELWVRNKCSDSVAVEGERAKDGKFELYAQIIPATSAEYGEGVRNYFISKGYDARLLEGASAAPAATPATSAAPGASGSP